MNKKKVSVICVNFNSYSHVEKYLLSLKESYIYYNDPQLAVEIYLADNSTDKQLIHYENFITDSMQIKYFNLDNLGYFGSAFKIYNNNNDIQSSDYLIISNVDVAVDKSFFYELFATNIDKNVAWAAPKIYSEYEKRDRNPKIIKRPSKKKMSLYLLLYKFPIIYYMYNLTLFKRKRNTVSTSSSIYAGHGSFIILTSYFLKYNNDINYPCFLFGEEIFLAEIIKKQKKIVNYYPNIVIYDDDHVSTKLMKKKDFFKYNYAAINYLRNAFYE